MGKKTFLQVIQAVTFFIPERWVRHQQPLEGFTFSPSQKGHGLNHQAWDNGCFQKSWYFPPQKNHPLKNRLFHETNHLFWGTGYITTPGEFLGSPHQVFGARLPSPTKSAEGGHDHDDEQHGGEGVGLGGKIVEFFSFLGNKNWVVATQILFIFTLKIAEDEPIFTHIFFKGVETSN